MAQAELLGEVIDRLRRTLAEVDFERAVPLGIALANGQLLALGSDSKLLAGIFELLACSLVEAALEDLSVDVVYPPSQTAYPDITLRLPGEPPNLLAIDVKSAYRRKSGETQGFTLGSYTGYLCKPDRSITFPYDQYCAHWVVGFIYSRRAATGPRVFSPEHRGAVAPVLEHIEVVLQEKWRLATDKPGSGNTANIASVKRLGDMREGRGTFAAFRHGAQVFEDYWRGLGLARNAHQPSPYSDLGGYLVWKRASLAEVAPSELADWQREILEFD